MSKISEQKALEAYPKSNEEPYSTSFINQETFNVSKRTGYVKGCDQAMKDFIEKACINFCKQCSWKCKYEVTKGEYCAELHKFKQAIMEEQI